MAHWIDACIFTNLTQSRVCVHKATITTMLPCVIDVYAKCSAMYVVICNALDVIGRTIVLEQYILAWRYFRFDIHTRRPPAPADDVPFSMCMCMRICVCTLQRRSAPLRTTPLRAAASKANAFTCTISDVHLFMESPPVSRRKSYFHSTHAYARMQIATQCCRVIFTHTHARTLTHTWRLDAWQVVLTHVWRWHA